MANERRVYLTTVDNPYDPETQFDDWYNFDIEKGYDSCGLLARIAQTADGLSDFDNSLEIERAIDEIVKYNVSGMHKKLVKN